MVSIAKAVSDTHLHQHKSTSLLLPLDHISSINSNNILKYRSGNNISSRKRIHNHSFQNPMQSINDNYQRFSNNNLINTHFPIVNIKQDKSSNFDLKQLISKTSSSQIPTVPKQAGTFIHRLLNKFFSITNINQNKKGLSRTKRIKHTRIASKRIKRRQRSKLTTNNKHCVVCRKYRNCFSILPMNKIQPLPTDSLDYTSQSPVILNSNAMTTLKNHSALTTEPSILSLPKIQLEKKRTLNESQCQTIASAVELIFDTLISNYQQI
jgi:hypothetical protein